MSKSRLAAILALGLGALALGVAAYSVITEFPRGPIVAALLIGAAVAAWHGLIRRGSARVAGVSCAALLVLAAVLIVILDGGVPEAIVRRGDGVRRPRRGQGRPRRSTLPLPDAPRPAHPVLFFNPKSGGGKAERFKLADEARARGIEPIELKPGRDLEQLVRDAVADGADGLAMAGGDGSQAVVAAIAAELDLPYACIPAGTRNHFALDLGVDRDDVVGALDAFVDGGERRVDLAEVNGRVFVNNVSLGLYAEAVQREGYREAKLRTILDTLPDALGPEGKGIDLQWTGPGGTSIRPGAAILVSNNLYRLGTAVGSGTRPRIDDGLLGITVAAAPDRTAGAERRCRDRGVSGRPPSSRSRADGPIAAGIDGEALVLEPRFASASGPPSCGCGSPAAPRRLALGRSIPEGLGEGIRDAAAAGGRAYIGGWVQMSCRACRGPRAEGCERCKPAG